MYAVFGLKKLLGSVVTLVILITLLMMFIEKPDDVMSTGKLALKVGSYTVSAFFLLGCFQPIFNFFWNLMNRILPSSYPNITGEWEGYLDSNVTVQEALREAARSNQKQFNQFDPEQIENIALHRIETKLTIKANILKIDVKINVVSRDKTSSSHSVVAKPIASVNGEPHRLLYIYESTRLNPEADDTQSHIGAAQLYIDNAGDALTLVGTYWTERNWRRASNTAGAMNFKRTNS
ncbi:Cap15 family cyclic dinucleotide receptor domain-containing protein [Pseudomonas frederiksbergensis]|uniref:Cap15 family cyclic dinucleotide receptor domain-containing protein n=1 Tax=Pseudomonas frederiksbergensis TaxID=104087 RepID=UPI000F47949F|nr:hypothetical protein [Pseudomonas frederiksbergensis]RON52730.1 hypothetical protein BK667_15015 [Pseudomonas frederiksbergensis]